LRHLKLLVSILIWGLLVFFLFKSLKKLPTNEEWVSYMSQNMVKAIFSYVGCFLFAMTLRAIRFGYLLKQFVKVPWKDIFIDFPWLFLLGAITPFRLGEGYRAIWVRNYGDHSAAVIGLWVTERIADMGMLAFILLVSVGLNPNTPNKWQFVFVFMATLCLSGYFILWLIVWLYQQNKIKCFHSTQLYNLVSSMGALNTRKHHLVLLSSTAVIWIAIVIGFWCVMSANASSNTLLFSSCSVALVNFAGIFSFIPGNAGGYQAVVVTAAPYFDYDVTTAFAASIILMSVALVLTIIVGTIFYIIRKTQPKYVRTE